MTSTERLKELSQNLYEVNQTLSEVKKKREQLKDDLFEEMAKDYKHDPNQLPVRSITVPHSFWDKTGFSLEEFLSSRFPGWDLIGVEEEENGIEINMRRRPAYMPYSVEIETGDGNVRVSKELNEYTPSIDWDTLQSELPELFHKLAKPVEAYEINEDELESLVEIDNDVIGQLQRHMKVREPAAKVTSRSIK